MAGSHRPQHRERLPPSIASEEPLTDDASDQEIQYGTFCARDGLCKFTRVTSLDAFAKALRKDL